MIERSTTYIGTSRFWINLGVLGWVLSLTGVYGYYGFLAAAIIFIASKKNVGKINLGVLLYSFSMILALIGFYIWTKPMFEKKYYLI